MTSPSPAPRAAAATRPAAPAAAPPSLARWWRVPVRAPQPPRAADPQQAPAQQPTPPQQQQPASPPSQPPAAAAAPPAAAPGGAPSHQAAANLSGLWARDERRSDMAAYERSLDVLGLSGLQKMTALKLIDGVEIRQDAAALTVSFVTVVPFFKVTERFPFAFSTTMSRRDLRPGRQAAVARRDAGGVRVEMSWGEPLAGSLVEEYSLLPDGALRVRATTSVGGRSVTADSVYTRTAQSKEQLMAARQQERK